MLLTVFRTAFFYVIVIICMRIMGKRQVGELQPSELVITFLISELASIPMQDLDRPAINGVAAILVLVFLELLTSGAALKSRLFRRLLDGKSAIIISGGILDQKMMKKLRVTIDDLMEGLRQNGSFSIEAVDYAIMETSGKISVLQKPQYDEDDAKDGKNSEKPGFSTLVISDGKLLEKAIDELKNTSKQKILKHLKQKNLQPRQIFIMTVDKNGKFYFLVREGRR